MEPKILVVDDEVKLRGLLSRIVALEGFEVLQAGDLATAWKVLEREGVGVVLCDVKLPDGSGVDFVKRLKALRPELEVVLLTAYGTIPDGVQAIKNGAFDYITKGDDNQKILPLLHQAVARAREAQQQNGKPANKAGVKEHMLSFEGIVGQSQVLRRAIALARKVSATDTTVLLSGETGTGKEVFAQAIHSASTRAEAPMTAINCAAFGRELLESELFGHKAGAFTGAVRDKQGLFEVAHRGTIFLDEVGEMEPELQAKLLRVLESGELLKVGETNPRKVDVRVIAATNRELAAEVKRGRFREDLYYRLAVFTIELPPLRERREDIPALARHFLQEHARKNDTPVAGLEAPVEELLKQQAWRGNIRELKNVMERALILCENNRVTADCLPLEMQHGTQPNQQMLSAFELASAEKLHIQKVLNHTGGNKTRTAELLGIALTTLYRKIADYQLEV